MRIIIKLKAKEEWLQVHRQGLLWNLLFCKSVHVYWTPRSLSWPYTSHLLLPYPRSCCVLWLPACSCIRMSPWPGDSEHTLCLSGSAQASGIWPTKGSSTWKYALSPDFPKPGYPRSLDSGPHSLCLELRPIFFSPYYQIHTCPSYPYCPLWQWYHLGRRTPLRYQNLQHMVAFKRCQEHLWRAPQIVPDN